MAKKILSMLLALTMILTMLAACNTDEDVPGLTLVEEGESDYVIVRGENAYISEITAATELQKYLKQITGVEIPIVTDAEKAQKKEIIVGKTNREAEGDFDREELGDDGLVIKTTGDKLWLVGGEQRGTLYAVYEFLESYLGCRFFTNTVEKVPEQTTISLEDIAENKQIPVFKIREAGWLDTYFSEYSAKRKLNNSMWGVRCNDPAFGGLEGRFLVGGHSLGYIISYGDYWETHPEYFSMGKDGNRNSGQRCLTNPDVFQIVIDYVRNALEGYTYDDPPIIHISQLDGLTDPCFCDTCRAVYEEEGGAYSGAYVRFINAIAAEFEEEYPDAMFMTYAYTFGRSAPAKTVPSENVWIQLCAIEECYAHPITDACYGGEESLTGVRWSYNVNDREETNTDGSCKTFAADLEDWGKITNNLVIYDYTCNFEEMAATYPNFDVLYDNYKFFAEAGVTGIEDEGNHLEFSAEFGELRAYLIAKMLWNPYITREEYYALMDEFLAYVYGPGWENIRAYIDLATELTSDRHFGCGGDPDGYYPWPSPVDLNPKDSYPETLTAEMIENYENYNWKEAYFWLKGYAEEPEILTEGERLFKAAMEAAETESQKFQLEKIYSQIEYLRLWFDYKELDVATGNAGKVVLSYYNAHPEEFTITQSEFLGLRRNIIALAREQAYEDYIEASKAFIEKLVTKYDIDSISTLKYLTGELDYYRAPDEWYIE